MHKKHQNIYITHTYDPVCNSYIITATYGDAHASMICAPGPLPDTYHLARYYSNNSSAITYMLNELINMALRTIHTAHPDVTGIYVYAYSNDNGMHIQLDSDSPYYNADSIHIQPSELVESGSNRRWYYWPIV